MTASPNIKTPAMDIPLLATPTARDKGEALKKLFTRVCLSEVCSMLATIVGLVYLSTVKYYVT